MLVDIIFKNRIGSSNLPERGESLTERRESREHFYNFISRRNTTKKKLKIMMKCTILFSLLMVCASAYEKRGILTEKLHASDEKFCETTEEVKS